MTLLNKKDEYLKGKIDKHQYMEEMFKIHKHLFEYPALIKDSLLEKIEITAEQVIFTLRSAGQLIRLGCDAREAYALPMSFLNLSAVETDESAMIHNLIKPGDVVFDVGANIGWYTISILLARRGATVYAFEPIKSNYQYLLKNLELNNQKTDKVYNFGFSDVNQTVEFFFDVKCATASSMANLREDASTLTEQCEVKRMDDFITTLPKFKKLDFIKCDVEGAELLVFRGAVETLKKYKPIVFSEILRKWSRKFGYHPNDIINLLREIGYECYVISKDKLSKFDLVNDETVETNYLFFHKEKHATVIKNFTKK